MGKVIKLFEEVKKMNSLYNVADYFINRSDDENPMTPLKLQKLCYYAQAWSLVWDGVELFPDDFQAWIHGPANYDLYCKYKNFKTISEVSEDYNINSFNSQQLETLDAVWDAYGKFSGKYLEQLTHEEEPWIITRGNLPAGTGSNRIIEKNIIKEYYSKL
jgi:uncharacterized phage-associated protein